MEEYVQQPMTRPDDGDRGAAIAALSKDQVRRLAAFANLCSRGLDLDGQDLLQTAYKRWLGSDRPVVGPAETATYLFAALKSIRFNEFRRRRLEAAAIGTRLEGDPDDEDADPPVETVPDGATSAEDSMFVQQLYDALDDPELKLLILHIATGTPRTEIQAELGWDAKKYDAVQKRKLRAVAKLINEGRI